MAICFTQPIHHGGYRFHLAPTLMCRRPPCPQGLYIGTFNIWGGRGFRLAHAMCAVQFSGFTIMIQTETNVTNQAYFHNMLVYAMVCLPEITMDAGGA